MDVSFHTHLSSRYLVAVVPLSATVASSARKLSVSSEQDPEHVCGQALRVGYTGTLPTDLALYRLKIKPAPSRPPVTLSGFFVLELGVFHAYEGRSVQDERAEQQ